MFLCTSRFRRLVTRCRWLRFDEFAKITFVPPTALRRGLFVLTQGHGSLAQWIIWPLQEIRCGATEGITVFVRDLLPVVPLLCDPITVARLERGLFLVDRYEILPRTPAPMPPLGRATHTVLIDDPSFRTFLLNHRNLVVRIEAEHGKAVASCALTGQSVACDAVFPSFPPTFFTVPYNLVASRYPIILHRLDEGVVLLTYSLTYVLPIQRKEGSYESVGKRVFDDAVTDS